MYRSLRRAVIAVAGALACSAAGAQPPMSDLELTSRAHTIVVGRAVAREPLWIGRELVTLVTVSVAQTLKGSPGGHLTVALPGGVDRRRRIPIEMVYVDAPQVATGEEVLLFLDRADRRLPGAFIVSGFSEGKRSIVTDSAGVKWVSRGQAALTGNGNAAAARTGATRLSEVREGIRKRLMEAGQ
jgi:hypothetical protein